MKLYGSLTSPFVRKVRAVAIARAVPVDFVVEDPWQMSPRLIAMNPAGKVPVLELDDGTSLVESLLIAEYLDSLGAPEGALIPAAGPARWEALRAHARAHALIEAVVARLLELRRPDAFQMPDRVAREEARVAALLDAMEQTVPDAPLAPDAPVGFGDLMLAVALRYTAFRYPHDWAPAHPRLAARLAALAERPAIRETEPPGAP
ncbi:glutathione S-transferase family protein [Aquabacter spiritensis]|uniref:Glutathione S-transferase n=1 Tax=Aquabacter spiritensis TaxID=933073 RepID=A0A4R3LZU0_9HYPH|nr:glutathione S-transferase N-terminal domain-containing protein [Aquabacter spiritensis]TCT06212.1 glutathione S-transferase [Aquabacter spiritensis]